MCTVSPVSLYKLLRINHVITSIFQQLFLSSLWETSSFFNHLESGQVGEASGLSGHLSKVVSDYQEIVNMQKAAVEQVRYFVTVNLLLTNSNSIAKSVATNMHL